MFSWIFKKIQTAIIQRRNFTGGYADYPGVGKVYDAELGEFAFKHMHWYDRLNPRMVGSAIMFCQGIRFGLVEEPKDKNWKFPV